MLDPLELDLSLFSHIRTAEEMHVFIEQMDIHDAILKEVTWITEDEMLQDLSLRCGSCNRLRIVIQSASCMTPVIELIAVNVEFFTIDPRCELRLWGKTRHNRIILSLSGEPRSPDAPSHGVVCETLYYRVNDITSLRPAQ
jgi:uncharacterized protein with PIN domain